MCGWPMCSLLSCYPCVTAAGACQSRAGALLTGKQVGVARQAARQAAARRWQRRRWQQWRQRRWVSPPTRAAVGLDGLDLDDLLRAGLAAKERLLPVVVVP